MVGGFKVSSLSQDELWGSLSKGGRMGMWGGSGCEEERREGWDVSVVEGREGKGMGGKEREGKGR